MNEHVSFSKYLSYLLDINALRLKIINKGKQCDDQMISEFINNGSNSQNEYLIIGSKESVYTFGTRVTTEYSIRVNQAQYQWQYFRLTLISWWRSFIESLKNMTFADVIQFVTYLVTFSLQLIVLYFRSLCNPEIGR